MTPALSNLSGVRLSAILIFVAVTIGTSTFQPPASAILSHCQKAELGSNAALQGVTLSAHRPVCFAVAIAGNLTTDRRWGKSKQLPNRAITEPGSEAARYLLAFQMAQGTCFAQPHSWRYAALDLTVIHAQERGAPKNRKPIEWKLITDLPIRSNRDAIEKLNWYAMRWKIEVFHKILKSGCRAEDPKPGTAQRLSNLVLVFCILS